LTPGKKLANINRATSGPFNSISFFLINSRSEATPLNLTPGLPDFIASSLNVNYVPGSNRFAAAGFTTSYHGGSVPLLGPSSYDLEAFINSSGVLNFGFLTIKGDIGSGLETLLSGNLNTGPSGTAFGFQDPPGGNIFEFLFTVTGGDPVVVNDFGGLGATNREAILNAEFQNGGRHSMAPGPASSITMGIRELATLSFRSPARCFC
jgi:hypothetical protein